MQSKKHIFLDLDGTLSEYWHPSGKVVLKKYDKGMFYNKLPCYSVIMGVGMCIRKFRDNVYILSASPNSDATLEKVRWVEKYVRPYISNLTEEYYIQYPEVDKIEWLKDWAKKNKVKFKSMILIDDHHDYLKRAEKLGIQVYHPSHISVLYENINKTLDI